MHDFDDDEFDPEPGEDGEDSAEARIWQLLVLINPGDPEMARQQFFEYREATEAVDGADAGPSLARLSQVIDWRSGFVVGADDSRALMQALDELSARWNLAIDWGGDADDEDFLADVDVPALMAVAHDRLAEHGYTLWAWEADGATCAGWITLSRDNELLREVATGLDINLRLGSEVS